MNRQQGYLLQTAFAITPCKDLIFFANCMIVFIIVVASQRMKLKQT